jgi:hypothetical protein
MSENMSPPPPALRALSADLICGWGYYERAEETKRKRRKLLKKE